MSLRVACTIRFYSNFAKVIQKCYTHIYNKVMKIIQVVAAIIERDGKYFATQRGYGEFKDGWEFPGGKIEPGESPEQALQREIREELNTEISVGRHLITVDYDYPQFHLHMACYLCQVVSGDLQLLEAEASRWLSPSELTEVDWLPADQEVVEALQGDALPRKA